MFIWMTTTEPTRYLPKVGWFESPVMGEQEPIKLTDGQTLLVIVKDGRIIEFTWNSCWSGSGFLAVAAAAAEVDDLAGVHVIAGGIQGPKLAGE